MKTYIYTHKTQYYETDRMGIIHHSNYIRWFEEARVGLLEEIGYPYQYLENELKIASPVLEVQCQYHSMVHFGDLVDIQVNVDPGTGVRMRFLYKIYQHGTKGLCTEGYSRHCFLNEKGRPVSLKKSYPELFSILTKYAET